MTRLSLDGATPMTPAEARMTRRTSVHMDRHNNAGKDWVNLECTNRMTEVEAMKDNKWLRLRFNPVVSIIATSVIWLFVVMCMSNIVEKQELMVARKSLTNAFTWLYIGGSQLWVIFILILFLSKYGNLKLGKDDEQPQFDVVSWFCMLFAAGVGVGLFYFGVAEPVYHYERKEARFGNLDGDMRAQMAMNQTLYHWGLHAWVVYAIVGLSMAFMAYRKGLPVTMRSAFYPLLGDKVMGLFGDIIDSMSCICTVFGVCTSLGLGVMDLSSGIERLGSCAAYDSKELCHSPATMNLCLWEDKGRCKNLCARISEGMECGNVASKDGTLLCDWVPGHQGGDCLPRPAAALGFDASTTNMVVIVWVITAIATISAITGMKLGVRALSIFTFSLGMFLMLYVFLAGNTWYYLDSLSTQAGLYLQSIVGLGMQTDPYARHKTSTGPEDDGFETDPEWMNQWTMFYWGWWISWSPFVGMFIAKISRGRTIREFIFGTITAPTLYGFAWFCIFGAEGLNIQRRSEGYNLTGMESPSYFNITKGVDDKGDWEACKNADDPWNPNCLFVSLLSARGQSDMWMDMISSFFGFGTIMMVISLFCISLYFVTSADSGSLVVDCLASNGSELSPPLQKLYWSVSVGAAATALLVVGQKDALDCLQAASICSGLPYSILVCFMCASLWRACQYEMGDKVWRKENHFKEDLLEIIDARFELSYFHTVGRCLLAAVIPWYFLISSMEHTTIKARWKKIAFVFVFALLFYLFPFFAVLSAGWPGAWVFGGIFYAGFAMLLAIFRQDMRQKTSVEGNFLEDFFASALMYPLVCQQMDAHFRNRGFKDLNTDFGTQGSVTKKSVTDDSSSSGSSEAVI